MANKATLIRTGQPSLLDVPFGQRTRLDLVRGVQTYEVPVDLRADITIAGGTTSGTLRNRGSLFALLDRVIIDENGDTRFDCDGRVLRMFAEMFAPQRLDSFARLVNGDAQANTLLAEQAKLVFSNPLTAKPQETVYMERNHLVPLQLHLQTVSNPYTRLISGGDRTLTVNSFVAEVGQYADKFTAERPLFIPIIREVAAQVITGTVARLAIPLRSQAYIAGLVILQEAGGYEVDDIITSLEMRGDYRAITDGQFTEDFLTRYQQGKFGGAVVDDGYLLFNFIQNGRLAEMVNGAADPNLRLVVDAGLSAVSGANVVRVFALEMQVIPALTQPAPFAI